MTDELPAQWALDKALEPMRDCHQSCSWTAEAIRSSNNQASAGFVATVIALARYIEKHEPAPVDPDLELAREICAKVVEGWLGEVARGDGYRGGAYDNDREVQFVLSKLKERGK